MPQDHVDSVPGTQVIGQLIGEIGRAMLTSGAPKGDHQVVKAAALIVAQAGIHQRSGTAQKLVDALLPAEIIDHQRIFSRERLEPLFASWIGQASTVENK